MSVRTRGLLEVVVGVAGAVAVGFLLAWLKMEHGYQPRHRGILIYTIPGALGAVGFLELVSGVPFTGLASRWDALAGWQRGVIGLLVVVFCFGLLIGGIATWALVTGQLD